MPRKQKTRVEGSRGWRLHVVGLVVLVLLVGSIGVVRAQPSELATTIWKAIVERTSDKLSLQASIDSADLSQAPADVSSDVVDSSLLGTSEDVFGASTDIRKTGLSPTGNCTSQKDVTGQITVSDCMYSGTIGTASSTFMDLVVRSGGPWFVKDAWIQLDTTAVSSTTRFYMGTSTISLAPDFSADSTVPARGIINAALVVTGTPYAIIDRGWSLANEVSNPLLNLSTSSTLQRISIGDHIVGYMTTGGSNIIQGSSVTSTAGRGFSASSRWFVILRRMSTSTQ